MECLVVKAHPISESLCSSLTGQVIDSLLNRGHQVELEDLYSEAFNASLTETERRSYYHGQYHSDAVDPQVKRLLSAEAVVLVFPTWWFGFPAILKGWFDRVWAPGIAYEHADAFGPIKPRLKGLKHLLAVTSLGSPWWVDRFILHQPVRKVLKTAIVGTCAPECRVEMLSLYKSEQLTEAEVARFSVRIDNALKRWPMATTIA